MNALELLEMHLQVIDNEYADYDFAAARERLLAKLQEVELAEAKLHERWQKGLPGLVAEFCARRLPGNRTKPLLRQLRQACTTLLAGEDAVDKLHAFDEYRDPDGATVLAALLYLTGHEKGAFFWWGYAAGAGEPIAAWYMATHHVAHRDQHAAQRWLHLAKSNQHALPDPLPEALVGIVPVTTPTILENVPEIEYCGSCTAGSVSILKTADTPAPAKQLVPA